MMKTINKQKEIFELLNLNNNGLFEITEPHFKGLFKLTNDLYIKQLNGDVWESSCFQLCDLLNGSIVMKPIERLDIYE